MHMLKYYVIDDAKNITREFDTLMSLAMYVKAAANILKNLNITGKDTIREPGSTQQFHWSKHFQTYIQYTVFEYHLRRYRIMDSKGRHIDPRTWTKNFWASIPEPARIRYHFWQRGSKYNRRRISGPAMRTRDARIANGFQSNLDMAGLTDDEFDQLEDLYIPAVRLRPGMKLYPIHDYNWYDKQFNNRCHRATNKSWKKNKRAPKQYMRHKPAKQLMHNGKHDLFLEACYEEQALRLKSLEPIKHSIAA